MVRAKTLLSTLLVSFVLFSFTYASMSLKEISKEIEVTIKKHFDSTQFFSTKKFNEIIDKTTQAFQELANQLDKHKSSIAKYDIHLALCEYVQLFVDALHDAQSQLELISPNSSLMFNLTRSLGKKPRDHKETRLYFDKLIALLANPKKKEIFKACPFYKRAYMRTRKIYLKHLAPIKIVRTKSLKINVKEIPYNQS